MNSTLRDRIVRTLESLPDERGYQLLDYVEFLESKYAERTAQSPNALQRFAEGVEDTLRAGRVSASTIAETMGLMNKAMGVLSGVAAAGKSVASDVVDAAQRNVARVTTERPTAFRRNRTAPARKRHRHTPAAPDADHILEAPRRDCDNRLCIWRAHPRPHARLRAPRTGAKRTLIGTITQIPAYLRLMGGLLTDPRVAALDKVLLGVAIAYVRDADRPDPGFHPVHRAGRRCFHCRARAAAADLERRHARDSRSLGWRDRGSASDRAPGSVARSGVLSSAPHPSSPPQNRSIDATTAGRSPLHYRPLAALLLVLASGSCARAGPSTRRCAGAVTRRAARPSSRPTPLIHRRCAASMSRSRR